MLPSASVSALPTACSSPVARPIRHEVVLHGQIMSYLEAGQHLPGPVVVLVHGLAGHAENWREVMAALSRHAHVIALDLLGHGDSAAPRHAEYSAGSHACRLRDLLRLLRLPSVHVVGHSFGGGVAMSFAYQFPERTESLTLVASGGLGSEVGATLRAASVPGIPLLAQVVSLLSPGWLHRLARHGAESLGLAPRAELDALASALVALRRPERRRALLNTLRGGVSWGGQRVDATDRLYLLAELPTLFIAGRRDRCIPPEHTLRAHAMLPASRLELLDAGHFPHYEHAERVGELIAEFVAGGATAPVTELRLELQPELRLQA